MTGNSANSQRGYRICRLNAVQEWTTSTTNGRRSTGVAPSAGPTAPELRSAWWSPWRKWNGKRFAQQLHRLVWLVALAISALPRLRPRVAPRVRPPRRHIPGAGCAEDKHGIPATVAIDAMTAEANPLPGRPLSPARRGDHWPRHISASRMITGSNDCGGRRGVRALEPGRPPPGSPASLHGGGLGPEYGESDRTPGHPGCRRSH